jgi:nucleoside-diphosphate-sugar epimerase
VKTMMILGAGFSGKAIARECREMFGKISGTTRSRERFAGLEKSGVKPLLFDGKAISDQLAEELAGVTHLVQSIAPNAGGDPFLALAPDLRRRIPNLVWAGYLSTIGVYGDHGGALVDETAAPTPLSNRSRERVLAENQWHAACQGADVTLAVLRLAGIYGPGRNAFINLANGTARRLIKKDQVFNRIRVEDIGRAAAFLLTGNIGGIYNVTDDNPSPSQDVVAFAAQLMGVAVPPDIPFEDAELSPMARSFYGENKRVSNRKLRAAGFDFLHPDYKKSFRQMWSDDAWN